MSRRNGAVKPQRSYEELLRDNPKEMEMLDRALEDATPEHKARVRGLLMYYKIEHDSEFYMLFVAFGHLTILVEEAPENWRNLFDSFERKLKEWATENLRTLEAIQQQSETTERMRSSFIALAKSTTALSGETKDSLTRLNRLNEILNGFSARFSFLESSSQTLLDRTSQAEERSKKLSAIARSSLICNAVLLAAFLLSGVRSEWRLSRQTEWMEEMGRQQAAQSERTQWLFEKATREECLTGIKPRSDPQCQQFF